MFRRMALACALLLAPAAWPAMAQVIVDMSLITCRQYQEMPPDRQKLVAWWMRGYFSAAKNFSTIDFRYVDYNTAVVTKYCKTHKNETLMSAIQQNTR